MDFELYDEPITLTVAPRGRPIKYPFPIMELGKVFYVYNDARAEWPNVRRMLVYWNQKFAGERRFVASVVSVGLKVQRVA
jgi:hypothetical protein